MNDYEEWKEIYPLLKGAYKRLKAEWSGGSGDCFSPNQSRMLYELSRQSPMKSTDLAEKLMITAGAVTFMTDKLSDMGLVRRKRGEEDRRVVYLEITEEGKQAYLDTFRNNEEAAIRYIGSRISKEDIRHLKRIAALLTDEAGSKTS
ncbi:MarR family winged helix-turn-helix transcriptional regulator [Paenibacillus arenilitoris]|uniref:MarR family transcriptional regulator n=1 Tax=Paenibacillus arenilitoris TaxID=2772299 RepID=A0A927CG21_9BACL|nr:MarR family transcriptional regulator [Paenibacillus arenilitoris]MBD2867418.1 MarR family transcriptional regulator [Paenibacillus arenilitoris]